MHSIGIKLTTTASILREGTALCSMSETHHGRVCESFQHGCCDRPHDHRRISRASSSMKGHGRKALGVCPRSRLSRPERPLAIEYALGYAKWSQEHRCVATKGPPDCVVRNDPTCATARLGSNWSPMLDECRPSLATALTSLNTSW